MGSWRSGTAAARRAALGLVPAAARSDERGPLLVVAAAGRFDAGRGRRCSGPPTNRPPKDQPGGSLGFADVGAAPAWRNLRAPMSAIPADATQVRLVATDDDLAPQHWIAVTPPRIPELRTLQDVVGSTDPVLLDWLVGLAFPCQRPFGHQNGVTEVPKWRILPDRFGAEANSPVMDYLGGGPLGITELLLRATPGADLSEGRLVPRLGRAAAVDAVVPERRSPPGSTSAPRRAAGCGARRRCGSAEPPMAHATNHEPRRLPLTSCPPGLLDSSRSSRASPGCCSADSTPLLPVNQTTATIAVAAGASAPTGWSPTSPRRWCPAPRWPRRRRSRARRSRRCPQTGGLVFSTIPSGGHRRQPQRPVRPRRRRHRRRRVP